ALLILGHIHGLAQGAVGHQIHRVIVVAGQLYRIGHSAVEHGVLGGVAGGHVIPGVHPLGLIGAVLSGLPGVGQVVPLGDGVAVEGVVIGHRRDAQGLAAAHQVLGQQVILKVGLVGGI